MKKIASLSVIISLFVVLFALQVNASLFPDIKASILRYDTTPAEQGNTIDVWVQLTNTGTKADHVAVRFFPEYPFSLPQGQSGESDVGTLVGNEEKVVKFVVF